MRVRADLNDGIAIVTIDRQEALNALDFPTLEELCRRLVELAEDDEARCVILTGAGDRAFIGGADIKYMATVTQTEAAAFAALGHQSARLLETMPKPTIAAINGYALGGGCEMALACDIRYAASSARLGQPEVHFGLIPGWGGTQRLARTTTLGFAKELIFTGRLVDADEAVARGLVDGVHDPVLDGALETARLIAGKSAAALAAAKELVNRALQGSHDENLAGEEATIVKVLVSTDAREGLAASIEKRDPQWAR